MKTRVLSVRLSYDTIAYCYALQEVAGRDVKGKPVGSVVSATIDALVEASRHLYDIPTIQTDDDAKEYLAKFVDKLPGFEPVDFPAAVAKVEEMRCAQGAEKEKTSRPEEASRPAEPVVPAEPEFKPIEVTVGQAERREVSTPISETKIDALKASIEEMKAGDYLPEREQSISGMAHFVENYQQRPIVGEPAIDIESAIETAAQVELQNDEKKLVEAVSAGVVERVSPDTKPADAPKCPWKGADMILETDELRADEVYKAACEVGELMATAVRVVYAVILREEWSSDKAIRLVKKTYNDYKKWEEAYGDN